MAKRIILEAKALLALRFVSFGFPWKTQIRTKNPFFLSIVYGQRMNSLIQTANKTT